MRDAETHDDNDPDDRIEDALADFIARRDEGEAIDPERFADEHPEIRGALLAALDAFASTDSALPDVRDSLPERIGPWRVLGLVGQGSFGRVLRVRHVDSGGEAAEPEYALKRMHDGVALQPRALERFRRECEALRSLKDPGIVRFHDHGVFSSCPYVVLELVEGPSLADLVEDARHDTASAPKSARRTARLQAVLGDADDEVMSSAKRIARLLAQIARSVDSMHRIGLLHRDLKPANVIVDQTRSTAKLIDLGLVGGDELTTLTHSGDVLGTLAYMSPEQARGETCDARSDVFGLGGILYEVLTLEPPRASRSSGSREVEMRKRWERRTRAIDPHVPKGLATICERALAFNPRWRHESAADFAEDLEHFAETGRAKTRGKSFGRRVEEGWYFHRTALVAVASAVVVALIFLWSAAEQRSREEATRTQMDRDLRAVELCLEARRGGDVEAYDRARATLQLRAPLGESLDALTTRDRARALALAKQIILGEQATGVDVERAAWRRGVAALIGGVAALDRQLKDDALEGEQLLTAAHNALPGSKFALRQLVRARRLTRKFAGGRAKVERLLRRADADANDLHEAAKFGVAAADRELTDRALSALEARGDRQTTSMLNTAAIAASSAGDMKRAHALYERIKRIDPKYALGRYNEAYSLDSECRLLEARDAYRSTIALEPKHARAISALAWLHAGSGREDCDKCRAVFAREPALFNPDRAEELLLRAIRVTQGSSSAILQSSIATAKRLGRRERLRALLEKIQRKPGLSDRRLARVTRALQTLAR